MRRVLGLDLGTNSIGWALVNEAEHCQEQSSIVRLGVRVNPLTVDEIQNFEKGKSITTNADRTLKRSMRRNLQRYKLRRDSLIEVLREHGLINDDTILSENGNKTTFETLRLRAKAASTEISLEEFARVLLMINKKRGYKSSRKAKSQEDGQLIDGMSVAKRLYEDHLTPGEFSLKLLQSGKRHLPDYYRSDLQREFDKVWTKQREFYPDILNDSLKESLKNKNKTQTWAICREPLRIVGIKRVTKGLNMAIENYVWREKALSQKMGMEQLAIVLQEINGQLKNSSGYLGAISDRSKELFFNRQTVGQYQMAILDHNPNASLRNMVFYRQDYLDEFETIWEVQSAAHPKVLTKDLKEEIRDVIIFYQRRLKSQKGLISFCEFESRKIDVEIDGKKKVKRVGSRVVPRSSPLFQEFKIWQILNNVEIFGKGTKSKKQKSPDLFCETENPLDSGGRRPLYQEEKDLLAMELTIKKELKKTDILRLLFDNANELDMNFASIQGNMTQVALFEAYRKIIEESGHEIDFEKKTAKEIVQSVEEIFNSLGYNTDILHYNSEIPSDEQPMYKLWHLLYSFEDDNSKTGNEKLIDKISELYGFEKKNAAILADVVFQVDYGSLSAKAIRKILPYLKAGHKYDVACEYAGYRHSASSLTRDELENKMNQDRLALLPRNSLRNPVVEKILNQMVNVINSLIETYGKPDEIRIELARELKKSAKEREELTNSIAQTTRVHEEYRQILSKPPFNLTYISRNDIIRYKLYCELKDNGWKTLYSNTYISPDKLFSGDFDIEHIIPQSRLFDDSFSNKTLELRSVNLDKSNRTAFDFVKEQYGETGLDAYTARIEMLFKQGSISKAKFNKLKMREKDIPDGFIDRDIRDTQYIAKYAKTMLADLVKIVVSTTGSITDRLREDWQLVDVMKELNWGKYTMLGLTEEFTNEEGYRIRKINDWTKRNDHRHHAVDALTVAFTKCSIIQYLNNLNARSDKSSSIYGIEHNELYRDGKGKLLFKPPLALDVFRNEVKKHLKNTLISIKAKNKVVTQNINKTNKSGGTYKKAQLTPRGKLHLETVHGSQKRYVTTEEKINGKFDEAKIASVAKSAYREALLSRLHLFGDDPKTAFTGNNALAKNPIWLDEFHTEQVPEKVKTVNFETIYTIRKEISPDLKIDKVIDPKIRTLLESRLKDYGGDAKRAFSNLNENPIWLNIARGIAIKRVTISAISNAESLHYKKDKDGNLVLDNNGKPQAVDFVNTGNNHHVALYRDAEGNLQENVVSFFEAVTRRNLGLPIIDKDYKQNDGWKFLFSMKQNEYFVFPNSTTGFNPHEIDLLEPDNYHLVSPNLFRVQTMSKVSYGNNVIRDYKFRHHLETAVKDVSTLRDITYKQYKTLSFGEIVVKVRVNHIGQIVSVGEY